MTSKLLRFDRFALDMERLCVVGPSGQVELRRKSFELLRYLVEHAGRVATQEELLRAFWPNVTIGDDSLTQCISEIRRAIGDDRRQIIKTVPRRGYLVEIRPGSEVATSSTVHDTEVRAAAKVVPLTQSLLDRPSIAVLPFTNLGNDPKQEYFADGIVEDIITELSRFSDLSIIARNSSLKASQSMSGT
jgi:adenylate cyclase